MAGRRLEELIDGRLQSFDPAPPVLSSAQSAWSGFPLERNVHPDGGAGSILFPETELVLVATGAIRIKYRAPSGDQRFIAGPSSVTIWPAGHESSPASWVNQPADGRNTEILRIQLDTLALERLASQDDPLAGLRPAQKSGIEDPALASLMLLMEADVAAGCPNGRLYGESLSIALAAHIAARHSRKPVETLPRGALSRPVLTRVLDFIRANLGRDLTITQLAAVADLSPHHFSLLFKRSVGVAPHQWVLHARVREAERLLLMRSMSVAEVALTLGFASQSHFTDVFRRLTGTTPKRYQQHTH